MWVLETDIKFARAVFVTNEPFLQPTKFILSLSRVKGSFEEFEVNS